MIQKRNDKFMLGSKLKTLLTVVDTGNFTRAAAQLYMTQPAVSHHIRQLEEEVGAPLIIRSKLGLRLTTQGEIVVKYARRMNALNEKMRQELQSAGRRLSVLRIGITHTSESNQTAAVLAKLSAGRTGLKIILFTEPIQILYDKLENYEIDLAIVDGAGDNPRFSATMLGTDALMCVMAADSPLARQGMVTLAQLRQQKMILRTPASATRTLFESALESCGASIASFDVILEVDNIATIKDLIRRGLGVSILPRSACLDELQKGKIAALPIENLSMVRETRILYNRDFSHTDIVGEIVKLYGRAEA